MKTILIPVDFSDSSINALHYAADLSKNIAIERIILLKSFYTSVYEQLLPSADFVQMSAADIQSERQKIEQRLKAIGREVIQKCHPSVKIETAISDFPLLRSIHQLIESEQPNLLIVGSDGHSYLDESYIGTQVIEIAKTNPVPVLIIPANVRYKKIERALIPCDFSAVSRFGPLKGLRSSHKWMPPEVMVLNVDHHQKYLLHDEENKLALEEFLGNYNYQIYYSDEKDTVKGVLNFAEEHHAQLIIALPGKHSFFYNLTHSSITEAIALNANQPVLILK